MIFKVARYIGLVGFLGLLLCNPVLANAPKAWIGIAFVDVAASELPPMYRLVGPLGAVQINQVFPGSSAALAELKENDLILAIQGTALNGRRTLIDALTGKKAGEKITLIIGRAGKKISITLSLSPRPEELSSITQTLVGSKAPNLQGKSLDKKISGLASLKGKAIVLDFWASWCGPCRYSHPMLEKAYQQYRSKGLAMVGISSETTQAIQEYLQHAPISFPQWQDPTQQTSNAYGAYALPTLVFISSDGVISRIQTGVPSPQELNQFIQEILPKKSAG